MTRTPATSLRLAPAILRRVDRLRAALEPVEGPQSRTDVLTRAILLGLRSLERRHPAPSLPEPELELPAPGTTLPGLARIPVQERLIRRAGAPEPRSPNDDPFPSPGCPSPGPGPSHRGVRSRRARRHPPAPCRRNRP